MESDLHLIEQKRELESMVIGEVVLENNYILIGSILGPQNFANYLNADNRIIWSAIKRMYPTVPVDLITIQAKLGEWYNVDYSIAILEYTNKVASTQHIRYHAILLLELDIRIKVLNILRNQYLKQQSIENFHIATDLHEMIEHIRSPKRDLFETLNGIISYATNENYTELHQELESILNHLPEKVKQVRRESQIQTCLSHLSKLTHMQPRQELLLEKLINTIKVICKQPNLDQNELKRSIAELQNLI